ncbi:flagellar outer dynein arm-docking complex [Tribonema minus]|uniref:Flagellar outer dynein arm-docking complex n=1 Tax=Tribonema minus TaxID=303371 RepID=A0A835YL73_9STRA|nr:flagellar outer dynein arm-docking complex [Tribonema minus]
MSRRRPEESSSMRVKKQQAMIETVQQSNEQMKTDLARESRESRFVTNPAAMKSIVRLQDQADLYAKKIEAERRKIEALDKQIAVTQARVLEQRQKMGGLNASEENNQMIARQINILENRLDKALVKFNESLAYNKTLRERIDAMRRERVVFDGIYKKLERELHERKKEMAAIIEDSNNAYRARDKSQGEMIALRQQAEKDRVEFESEWKELGELIEQDRKLRDTLQQRQQEKAAELRSTIVADGGGGGETRSRSGAAGSSSSADAWGDAPADSAENYEAAFKRIQEATGLEGMGDIVNSFLEAEEKNFSLFNFVNDLNSEIERLELSIAETANEIESHKGAGVSTDSQRKKALRDLEEQLVRTEGRAEEYEERCRAAVKTIAQLKSGIHSIFLRIGASHSSSEELLGNQGVTESNMMQYLGLIEQRTSEILAAYAQSQSGVGGISSAAVRLDSTSNTAASSIGGGGTANAAAAAGPQGRLRGAAVAVQPPALDDLSSGEDSDGEDNERPLTRQELKSKTLRGMGARMEGGQGGVGGEGGERPSSQPHMR